MGYRPTIKILYLPIQKKTSLFEENINLKFPIFTGSNMKKIIILSVLIFSIISCTKENEMRVQTTITGLQKGTVYLQKIQDTVLITLDSLVIDGKDETFTLTTEIDTPELFYIYIDKLDGIKYNDRITFFGEKGDITLNTHLNKVNSNIVVTGSKSNIIYENYKKTIKSINTQLSQENIRLIQAQMDQNEENIVAADKKAAQLMRAKYLRAIQFAFSYKRSAVAAYIGAREIPEAQTKYLDSIYNGLSKKAKKTIYGVELANLITERKK